MPTLKQCLGWPSGVQTEDLSPPPVRIDCSSLQETLEIASAAGAGYWSLQVTSEIR